MNNAKIIAVTQSIMKIETDGKYGDVNTRPMNAEEFIAYTARVSNPGNQYNTLTAPKLLKYLIDHKHWSPQMKSWKELDFREQMMYIRQAEYLQEKGYFPGMDSFVVAEILYKRRNR